MAQHVDMDREGQPCRFTGPFDHVPNAHAAEWMAALVDEHVAGPRAFGRGPP